MNAQENYLCACGAVVKRTSKQAHFASRKHRDASGEETIEVRNQREKLAEQRKMCQLRFQAKPEFMKINTAYSQKYASKPENKTKRNIYMRAYNKEYRAKKAMIENTP